MKLRGSLRTLIRGSALLTRLLLPALAIRTRYHRWRAGTTLQILDRFTAVLVEDPVVSVRGFPGKYVVGCKSDIFKKIALTGAYEPELVAVCEQYLDRRRDVIDVGANVGLYTVLLASMLDFRTVLAVEPTPGATRRLRANIAANGVAERVRVFDGVASDKTGELQLHVVPDREEYSSLGAMDHPRVERDKVITMTTVSATIDSLVADCGLDVGFIKIDVEGMEHAVILGMDYVLRNMRPVVLAELCDSMLRTNGSSASQVVAAMESYGYEVIDPLQPEVRAGAREFGDMLCLPNTNSRRGIACLG